MSPFRYGRDLYTDEAAQQLSAAAGWLLIALAGAFVAVHLLRRSPGHPVSTSSSARLPSDIRVLRYQIGARLYHWANTLVVVGLAASGIALFSPGTFGAAPWLLVHEILAVVFVIGVALHIVVAPTRGEGRSMWFEARDLHDLRVIVANFLGRTHDYPAFGKYDPLQKLYHAMLALLAAGLTFSGAGLLVNGEAWATFSHEWMRSMRLVHDITGFAFIAIVLGHVYFGIIRVNWPHLVSMWTGRLRGSSFNLYHDASRWHPRDDEEAT
jgi:Ni/Fe-hydrogenase 1 B-type cytochrome subunit